MRLSYNNLLDNATLTASSEIAGYEVENVQDQRLTKKWYSDTTTTQTVIVDLGSAQTVTAVAILAHNITSSATIIVNGNAVNVWTSPSVIESLTWNSDIIFKFITGGSYRYWRFSFSGLTDGVEIGRLWLGPYDSIDPSSTLDFKVTKVRSDTVVYGKSRQKYASPGVGWRRVEYSFPPTATTTLSVIESLYETSGNHSSFLFMNFDSLTSYPLVKPLYGSLVNEVQFTHNRNMKFTYQVIIEEDL